MAKFVPYRLDSALLGVTRSIPAASEGVTRRLRRLPRRDQGSQHRCHDVCGLDFQKGRYRVTKVLRLTLAVRIFEQLAAEAEAANIPSVELACQFITARYELGAALAGSAGAAGRTLDIQPRSDLLREGEVIFLRSIEAYGRIVQDLAKVFATTERLARIGKDLQIVGDGISLLRELLDQLETLRPAGRARRGSPRRPMPDAANDDGLSD
jgi:hypothetical protein